MFYVKIPKIYRIYHWILKHLVKKGLNQNVIASEIDFLHFLTLKMFKCSLKHWFLFQHQNSLREDVKNHDNYCK